jgi:hypothetical protein
VLENRVLRIKFGPKREEVAGSWRKQNSEGIHELHASPDIIWEIKSSMK